LEIKEKGEKEMKEKRERNESTERQRSIIRKKETMKWRKLKGKEKETGR